MKYIIILLGLLIFVFQSKAQSALNNLPGAQDVLNEYYLNQLKNGNKPTAYDEADVKGNPWLTEEFREGEVYLKDGRKLTGIKLRLNLINSQFEFYYKGELLSVQKSEADKIIMGGEEFILLKYLEGNLMRQCYVQVLKKGKYNLYLRNIKVFEASSEAVAIAGKIPAKFTKKPDKYYIQTGEALASSFVSKKQLCLLFSPDQEKAAKYIRSNKVKYKKKEGLERLINYFNGT